jgi:radical SAM protein with 4Fe4S-binding SPASM domain
MRFLPRTKKTKKRNMEEQKMIQHYLWEAWHGTTKKFPLTINIETTAFCNRQCEYCFNHPKFQAREKGVMKPNLYAKIMAELEAMKFKGVIKLSFFGEPLMDNRIKLFTKMARESCPKAEIRINTNGDFLTENLLRDLIRAGLNTMILTDYNNNFKKLARKYYWVVKRRMEHGFRKYNRLGKVFPEKKNDKANKPCIIKGLVIDWKGNYGVCCNDYYTSFGLGNAEEMGVLEVWNSTKFKNIRKKLAESRNFFEQCKGCDT